MKNARFLGLGVLLCLVGCSGGSSGGGGGASRSFSGAVTAAKVIGAEVKVFQINDDLTLTLLQTGSTDGSGNYTLTAASEQPMLLVAGGGSYVDEASGNTLALSAIPVSLPTLNTARPGTLSAILGRGATAGAQVLSLNPLTTIATARIAAVAASDATALDSTSVDTANGTVASEFGLTSGGTPVDPRTLTPLDPSDATEAAAIASNPQSPEALLGTIQAGLSQSAQSAGLTDPLDLIDALATDYSDGALDGSQDGASIPLGGSTLTSSAGTTQVAEGTTDFLDGSRNQTTLTTTTYTTLITSLSSQDTTRAGVNVQPSAVPVPDQSATVGTNLDVTLSSISAGTGETSQTLTVTASSSDTSVVPSVVVSGAGATRTLSLTPVAAGTSTITITIQDDGGTLNGGVDTATLSFVVTASAPPAPPAPGNVAPVFSLSSTSLSLHYGDPVDLTIEVNDPDGDTFSMTILNPPPGAALTPIVNATGATTRSLLWQVSDSSVSHQRILLRATDGTNVSIQAIDVEIKGKSEGENQLLLVGDVTGDGLLDVVCGAPQADVGGVANAGAVYVWAGTTVPAGAPTATLTKPSPTTADVLGLLSSEGDGIALVDVTGDGVLDVVVAGDSIDTTVNNAGAVLVWSGGPGLSGAPAPLATLQIPTPTANDRLGSASGQGLQFGDVTGDGVLDLVVGAQGYDSTVVDAGGVFVWAGGGTLTGTPTPTAILIDATPDASEGLGSARGQGVCLGEVTGDTVLDVVACAPRADTTVGDAGEIFVWAGGGGLSGTPAATATLRRANPLQFDYIGGAADNGIGLAIVDVTGDGQPDVLAPSTTYATSTVNNAGGVLLWAGGSALSGTQTETAELLLSAPADFDELTRTDWDERQTVRFGDVTGDGITDVVVVGSLLDLSAGLVSVGRVVVFAGGSLSGTVTPMANLGLTSPNSNDSLGDAQDGQQTLFLVDLSGDGVLDIVTVGAEIALGGQDDAGAVLFWAGGATLGVSSEPTAILQRATPLDSDLFGSLEGGGAVLFGDVTGDGIKDVLIASSEAQTTVSGGGEVLVFAGGTTLSGTPSPTATLRKPTPTSQDQLSRIEEGRGIRLGDVTGNGILDVVIGAELADGTVANQGVVLVFRGGTFMTGTPNPLIEVSLQTPTANDGLGGGGLILGDVTGDGVLDIVAVTPKATVNGNASAGLIAVIEGGPNLGQFPNPTALLLRAAAGVDQLGNSGSPLLADLDADGVLDILAVASGYDGAASQTGAVFFWRGGSTLSGSVAPTSTLQDAGAAAFDQLGNPNVP